MVFYANYPLPAILGVLLFNMTMPVTLAAVSNILVGRAGFAFGLTALALLIGALPVFTEYKDLFSHYQIILLAVCVSMVALYLALILYFRKGCLENQKIVENP